MSTAYNCTICTNKLTPICKLCTHIERPTGEKTRPTMYVRESELKRPPEGEHQKKLAVLKDYFHFYIAKGLSFPVEQVMFYNSLIEHYSNSEEEAKNDVKNE